MAQLLDKTVLRSLPEALDRAAVGNYDLRDTKTIES